MFKIPKLLINMDVNISRGAGKAERAVRQAYEDDIRNGTTRSKVKNYMDREKEILRGNKAKRSKDLENMIGGWN